MASALIPHLYPAAGKPRRGRYGLGMGSLAPRMIITGWGASVSPVAVIVLLSVLSRSHARKNSLLRLLGFTSTLLALGFAGLFVLQAGGSGRSGGLDRCLDTALGTLCLLAIPYEWRRERKDGGWKVADDMSPARSFALGRVTMAVNISTFIIYVSGLHAIAASDLRTREDLISLAVLTFFTLTTLLLPLAIYSVFPSRSKRTLPISRGWLAQHRRAIGAAILLLFGIYLLAKGLRALF